MQSPLLPCPKCKNLLVEKLVRTDVVACGYCGVRILADDRYRIALQLAGEGKIDHASWKEIVRNDFLAVGLFLVLLPMRFIRIINLFALCMLALLIVIFIMGCVEHREFPVDSFLRIAVMSLISGFLFFVLPRIEPAIKKVLPNSYVQVLYFFACKKGLVIVEAFSEPILLPWYCIFGCTYTTNADGLAHTQVEYSSETGEPGTLTLQGEEYAAVLDIVRIASANR